MSVLKTLKNGVWEAVSGMSEHSHNMDNVVQIETEVVFPETTLTLDSGSEDCYISGFYPEVGETYKITWNGVTYTCTAKAYLDESYAGIEIGDDEFIDTPFFIFWDASGMIVWSPTPDTFTPTLSITKQKISKVDDNRIFYVDICQGSDGTSMVPVTIGQIKEAYSQKRPIIAKIHDSGILYEILLPMNCILSGCAYLSFSGFSTSMGTPMVGSAIIMGDDSDGTITDDEIYSVIGNVSFTKLAVSNS